MKIAGDTNPIVSAAFIAISTVGLQFYSEDRQQMIEQLGLAGGMSTEEISSLKHLGKKILSPLEEHGLSVPSVGEVQQAWGEVLLDREWATLQNEVIGPASGNRTALVAALRQAADELEGN